MTAHDHRWDQVYALLVEYAREHGTPHVPQRHTTPDGFCLGQWLKVQRARYRKGILNPDRAALLTDLGIDLSADAKHSTGPWAQQWANGIAHLREFKDTHGHANPPQRYTSPDGYNLGTWLSTHRLRRTALTPERYQQLLDIGVTFDPNEIQDIGSTSPARQAGYRQQRERTLAKFEQAIADGIDPTDLGSPAALSPVYTSLSAALTRWRSDHHRGLLDEEIANRLTALGVDLDQRSPERQARAIARIADGKFDKFIIAMTAFMDEHGHDHVPTTYKTTDGYYLYAALTALRKKAAEGTLPEAHRERLADAGIPLVRTPRRRTPKTGKVRVGRLLTALAEFTRVHGHAHVPSDYRTADGYDLYASLSRLRTQAANGALPHELRERLADAGVDLTPRSIDQDSTRVSPGPFARLISELDTFTEQHGHANVPHGYRTPTGYHLYPALERRKKQAIDGTLPDAYRDRLTASGVTLPNAPTP